MTKNHLWLLAATALAVPILGILAGRTLAARQLRHNARQLPLAALPPAGTTKANWPTSTSPGRW